MKIILLVILFTSLFSKENVFINKEQLNSIKKEIGAIKYKTEYRVYKNYVNKLNLINEQKNKIKPLSKNTIILTMNKLSSLQKSSHSIILSFIVVSEYLKYFSIKDATVMKKYLIPSSKVLLRNKMCDGYIYYGEYLENIKDEPKESMDLYKEGMKECNIEWKNFALLSRYRKLKYLYGIK